MSEVISAEPNQSPSASTSTSGPSIEVFAVYGAEPEIQAYAMAKYSRSSLSMKESLREITTQKAEKFLNTFYFQYGHRSIADLAHIALAIERLSILAAIVVADEQRWDGQERSTRYQDFKKSGYYTPNFENTDATALYTKAIQSLFTAYAEVSQKAFEYLASITPRPADMKPEGYERTLRARAFDISRYLLPLATNTSLGEIVNARTLETQVAHLLSQPHREVRELGALLKKAAISPAYNANEESLRALVKRIREVAPDLADHAERELLHEVRVAPTLVKYADPNSYEIESRRELQQAAAELMRSAAIAPAPLVDLLDTEPLEIELAATLLYGNCHYSYRQIRRGGQKQWAKRAAAKSSISASAIAANTTNCPRTFSAGQEFRFDILMDIGGFRDMHRHRRCVQIMQDFTTAHGYDTPPEIEAAGIGDAYATAMKQATDAVGRLENAGGPKHEKIRNTPSPSPSASAPSSKWISPRRSTSRNCAPRRPATPPIAMWPTRCMKRWRSNIPRSPNISAWSTSANQWIC